MPLDAAQIEETLRKRGLLDDKVSTGGAPPPTPVAALVTAPQEGYTPGVGLVVNIPGTPSANTPEVAAPAGTPASAAPTAAPAGVAPVAPAPAAASSERDATIARARATIGSIESSDRYDIVHPPAKNGQVALGRYGILSSGLADDSRQWYGRVVSQQEFLKSPEIQDKIFDGRFGALVDKYGVEGAARAWFAGEGGMNNPGASDGNSTVANYSREFMQRFSGEVPSPSAAREVLDKRGIAPSTEGVRADSGGLRAALGSLSPSSMFEDVKTRAGDWAQAFTQYEAGVMKGIAHVALAPVQTVSEMTGDWYKPVEARVSQLEDMIDSQTGGKGSWPDLTGRVVGSVAAMVVGARALGPLAAPLAARVIPQLARSMWSGIGPVGRSMGTAAAVGGGTTYYQEGAESEKRLGLENLLPVRAIDAATFGALGPIGGVVARGATWIAENLARTTSAARSRAADLASEAADAAYVARAGQAQTLFNQVLQRTANGMTQNSEGPLRNVVQNYARVEQIARSRYGLRNAAGQDFEGFPAGVAAGSAGLRQALGEGAEATAEAGVRQSSKAATARATARDELGLPAEEARYRGWQTQQAEYERRALEWQTATEANKFAGPNMLRQLEQTGQIPPRPVPPPLFEPTPVTAMQWAAARGALTDAWKRAKGDAADQTQISQMIAGLDRVAETEAAAYGMPVKEFVRKAEAAAKYYEENVAPLRYGLFKGRTSKQLEGRPGVPLSGMTPAEFNELVMKPVRDNDLARVRDLAKVLGPRAQSDMAALAASEAILLSERGARKFVNERKEVLTTLLGPDEYRQLQGMATIAEHMLRYKPFVAPKEAAKGEDSSQFVSKLLEGGGSSRIGAWLGFYQLGRAVLGVGNVGEHLRDAALYFGGPPMLHFAYNTVTNLHRMPILRPLVRRAAGMEPGSKELDNYLLQIERRIRGTSNATLRGASEAVDQQQ